MAGLDDDPATLVGRRLLDLRICLHNPALPRDRRQAMEVEREALRLALLGVRMKGQRGYLARCGVTRTGRQPRLTRGPREWGDRTAVRIVGG